MRDHNYQSRMKNCHVRFILTVDNEKSFCEKKKSLLEIIDWFFLSWCDITGQRRVFGGIFSHPQNGGATERRRLNRVY